MLDPIFDLLAGLLAWFYSLVPSYGFAIIALTTLVLLVLSPLTYRSTKSMVSMRRLQPQVKRIQKKHAGDRERMNQEMMALYQEHGVSPLSGCLPILIQSPVFIVMFRVLRGITRRSSDIGFDAARVAVAGADAQARDLPGVDLESFEQVRRNFNPEYLSQDSELYQALILDNEMLWLGLDLSRTPLELIGESISGSIPYLLMVALVAFLGWYQQRQIAGRSSGEISSQQQMIMKIIPWMLPIFSFSMPAGLILYFIVSSLLRILQQAYLTRAVYGDEELTTPIEIEVDEDDDFDYDADDDETPDNPLAGLFGGGAKKTTEAAGSSRHGSRRPVSETSSPRQRTRPPRESSTSTAAKKDTPSRRNRAIGSSDNGDTTSGWGRARRSAAPKNDAPEKPASRRVTPKGEQGRQKKK